MFQARIHGHGGQGVVTTAEVLSIAAFHRGWYAQALPSYQWERPGIPVTASCRISDRPIRTREPVTDPDVVIVEDASLLIEDAVLAGLGPEGFLLVNSSADLADLGCRERLRHLCRDRLLVVPATRLAFVYLGRPLPGAALLGGLAALTSEIGLDQVLSALRERFAGGIAQANVAAARAGYAHVAAEREALSGV